MIFKEEHKKEIYLRCFPYEIDTIISNLITNSTASFDKVRTKERKIYIEAKEENEYIRIDYSDTGVGLVPFYKKIQKKHWKYLKPISATLPDKELEQVWGYGL